jgi:putative aldouronate transport system permease protein
MKNHILESRARRVGIVINEIASIFLALMCLLPIMYILSLSLSGKNAILSGKIGLFPVEFTLDSYIYVADDSKFINSLLVSVERTLSSVIIQMTLIILAAYPLSLSSRKFSCRPFYTWFFIITILFTGGLVPMYLVVSNLGIINTFWSLILPLSVNVFNVILMQNFIKALPEAISEAAFVDGAGHGRTLFQILLPLCKPALATLTLFCAVSIWNEWYHGMLFIDKPNLWPLQTYLRTVVVEINMDKMTDLEDISNLVTTAGSNAAKIFLAMLPILLVYPFLQKYFVTGLVYGSVKE